VKRPGLRSASGARPAVFLDRDGTIVDELGFLDDPTRVRLLPGAARAIARLNGAGLPVLVITNQSGIARGLLDERILARVHARLAELLAADGAHVDGFYHCPHHPEVGGPCACRKPEPGLVLDAAREHGVDLGASWLVGDADRDLEAARRAGVPGRILVLTGKGEATHARLAAADGVRLARDLGEAVELVLSDRARR
jgi:D-glycero-D-manno-heptose 1,7-bisphosphate phosphatase